MKIGVCADKPRWKAIADAGFDYLEANFSKIASLSDEDFDEYLRAKEESGICVEAYNGFFSSKLCIYGNVLEDGSVVPSFASRLEEIKEYAEKAFSRASRLGGRIAVLGSSGARNIREGVTREMAEEQFVNVLRTCGDVAQKYGMKIAIEPLRYAETNFIHTVREGLEMCKRANHPAVGLLVDFFHFYMNGEPIESVAEAKDYIIHAHMARPDPDRKYPTETDIESCKVWADTLKSIGYAGRISLECSFGNEFDKALEKVRCVTDLFR